MNFGRDDYNQRYCEADRAALTLLFSDMIRYIETINEPATIGPLLPVAEFAARFLQALPEVTNPHEPVFLIKGHDHVAADAVRAWAHLHRINGGSDPAYASAMRHAALMEAVAKKKAADL